MSVDSPIDGILLLSFGGPERPEDVMPFLRQVTKGRDVPEERLLTVAAQYQMLGGASPINEQNRALVVALRSELRNHGIDLPVYWGNRNWHPFVEQTVQQMADDSLEHVLVFVTSAYSSYSGCRQYQEDLARACALVEGAAPTVEKLRQFFNHPGFVEPMIENTNLALQELGPPLRQRARLVFTAHSLPLSMAVTSRYEAQLREAAGLVTRGVMMAGGLTSTPDWELVFQSRSGSPRTPWLGPDVTEHLAALQAENVEAAVIVPIGFVSDHMEIVHDLDLVAVPEARASGMQVIRAATVGTAPRFVSMIRELIEERLQGTSTSALSALSTLSAFALGEMGPISCTGEMCCPAAPSG